MEKMHKNKLKTKEERKKGRKEGRKWEVEEDKDG